MMDNNIECQCPQEAIDTQRVEICALGNELTDCPARRVAGCRNHYELLNYMYPPLRVLAHVRDAMGNDPDARQWIARLDAVLPGRPTFSKWGGR